MAFDDVLAAIGGGLGGIRTYKNDEHKREVEDARQAAKENELRLREMIATLNEGGRNARFTQGEEGKTSRTGAVIAGQDRRAAATDATTRRGQDMTDERYWSGENPLQWDRNFLTSRGQDVSSANNQRTNATQRRGQDLGDEHYWDSSSRAWDQGQQRLNQGDERIQDGEDNHAMDYALGAYRNEIARRRAMRPASGAISVFAAPGASPTVNGGAAAPAPGATDIPDFKSWLDTTDDPEIFPSVRRAFGGTRPDGLVDTGQPRTPGDTINRGNQTGTPRPLATPAAPSGQAPPPAAKPAAPVTPKVKPAGSGAAGLEQQAAVLIAQIRQQEATTGKPAADLRAQLARLRDQARGPQ
jgi:hypothetical protein